MNTMSNQTRYVNVEEVLEKVMKEHEDEAAYIAMSNVSIITNKNVGRVIWFDDGTNYTHVSTHINEPVVCKDGFSMSVQASLHHRCRPRIHNAAIYYEVEVGLTLDDELMEYAECDDYGDPSVYNHVPTHVVAKIITKHGGAVKGELPPGVMSVNGYMLSSYNDILRN